MAREISYMDAIREALREEMRRDPQVFVLGEDVGVYGGAFKVTDGFQDEFGPWRVIDMPLSETAIVAGATGAACGYRSTERSAAATSARVSARQDGRHLLRRGFEWLCHRAQGRDRLPHERQHR